MEATKDQKISVYVDPDLVRDMKMLALQKDKTLSQIAAEAFELLRVKTINDEYSGNHDY